MGLKQLKDRLLIGYYKRLALNSYVCSDFENAVSKFQKILAIDPKVKGIHFNIGLAFLSLKDYQKAEEYILKETKIHGHSYPTDKALADLAFLSDQREKALKYYKKSLKHKDCEFKPLLQERISQCESEEGFNKLRLSITIFEDACKMMEQKEYDKAFSMFQKSVDNDPKNYNALNNMGTISMNIYKNYPQAEGYFRLAYDISRLPAIESNLAKLAKLKSQGAF